MQLSRVYYFIVNVILNMCKSNFQMNLTKEFLNKFTNKARKESYIMYCEMFNAWLIHILTARIISYSKVYVFSSSILFLLRIFYIYIYLCWQVSYVRCHDRLIEYLFQAREYYIAIDVHQKRKSRESMVSRYLRATES